MRKICFMLALVLLILSVSGCSESAEKEWGTTATYDNCILELQNAVTKTNADGESLLYVTAHYTNEQSEPLYAYCSVSVKAFQNDRALEDCSDINEGEKSLITEVKNGNSVSVCYAFALTDDSPVEVLVCTPTAEEKILAKKSYLEDAASSEA